MIRYETHFGIEVLTITDLNYDTIYNVLESNGIVYFDFTPWITESDNNQRTMLAHQLVCSYILTKDGLLLNFNDNSSNTNINYLDMANGLLLLTQGSYNAQGGTLNLEGAV